MMDGTLDAAHSELIQRVVRAQNQRLEDLLVLGGLWAPGSGDIQEVAQRCTLVEQRLDMNTVRRYVVPKGTPHGTPVPAYEERFFGLPSSSDGFVGWRFGEPFMAPSPLRPTVEFLDFYTEDYTLDEWSGSGSITLARVDGELAVEDDGAYTTFHDKWDERALLDSFGVPEEMATRRSMGEYTAWLEEQEAARARPAVPEDDAPPA